MTTPLFGYFNGRCAPVTELAIPISDYGFTMGVTITEQMRTWSCRSEIPLLHRHMQRFQNGLESLGLAIPENEILAAIELVVKKNVVVLESGNNLGLGLCATPGTSPRFPDHDKVNYSLLVYPYVIEPEADKNWAAEGVSLSTVLVKEISRSVIPKSIKSRSRLHYFLADAQAHEKQSGSKPLLADDEGRVAESSTGSVGIIRDGEIVFPPRGTILDSVSLRFAIEDLGIEIFRAKFCVKDCLASDAMVWINAVTGPLAVSALNGNEFSAHALVEDFRSQWWDAVKASSL